MYDEQYNYTVHEGMFLVVCPFCPIFSMKIHVEKIDEGQSAVCNVISNLEYQIWGNVVHRVV